MTEAADLLRTATLALYLALAVVAFRRWRTTKGAPAAWVALTFGTLGIVLVAGRLVGDDRDAEAVAWLVKGLVAILIVFPYLLYRFTAAFARPPARIERIATGSTILVVTATLIVPSFPGPGDPRPAWVLAFTVALLMQWTFLLSVVAIRLWGAGKGQPTVPRRRTRLLAIATLGLNVAIIASSAGPADANPALHMFTQSLSIMAGVLLLIGLAPPAFLRQLWQRRESGALQEAVFHLMAAETREQVAASLLPPTARVLGAGAIALSDPHGKVIGAYGIDPAEAQARADAEAAAEHVERFELRNGVLTLWASPYMPFFAQDELDMIRALCGVVDLALDRCTRIEADRRFIANAAHELRTPLTTLSGLSMTLSERRHLMTEQEIGECFDAMARQGDRTRILINNLLDLAQLDHGEPRMDPGRVRVSDVARRALEAAPPPRGLTVSLHIPDEVSVLANDVRVEQMIVNLLTNSYRYGGAHVTLEGFDDAGGVLLVVSDDGPGVARELVPHLFEPFGRGSVGSHLGSGLGLAIVRRLATTYGGDVWYEPRRPHGACFTIRLPSAA